VKAPVVRRIFDLYTRKRLGTTAIANQLREEQAPAPAAGWGHPAVHWIIGNPTYTGRIRWRDRLFDGVHEPLIDEVTFQRAQAILRERGEDISRRRGNASDFLLSGVVRCARCGKAYVGMSARGNGGRYEYYACSGRQKHGPKACRNERLPRQKLEHAVLQQLASLFRDGDLVAEALARAEQEAARTRPEIEQRLASIRAGRSPERNRHSSATTRPSSRAISHPSAATSGSRGSRRASKTSAPRKPSSPSRPRTSPDVGRRRPISQPSPTNSNASSPRASRRRRRHSSGLIHELRVDGRAQIQPTYRLVTPEVCATSEKVGATGIEPVTACL
jgi:site-specific DNA recombinase